MIKNGVSFKLLTLSFRTPHPFLGILRMMAHLKPIAVLHCMRGSIAIHLEEEEEIDNEESKQKACATFNASSFDSFQVSMEGSVSFYLRELVDGTDRLSQIGLSIYQRSIHLVGQVHMNVQIDRINLPLPLIEDENPYPLVMGIRAEIFGRLAFGDGIIILVGKDRIKALVANQEREFYRFEHFFWQRWTAVSEAEMEKYGELVMHEDEDLDSFTLTYPIWIPWPIVASLADCNEMMVCLHLTRWVEDGVRLHFRFGDALVKVKLLTNPYV